MAEDLNNKLSGASEGLMRLTEQLKEESAADKTGELIAEIKSLANSVEGLSSEFGKEFGSLIAQSDIAIQQGDIEVQVELQAQLDVLKEIATLQEKQNKKLDDQYTESYKQSELTKSVNMTLEEQKASLQAVKDEEQISGVEKLISRLEMSDSNETSQMLAAQFTELKTKLEEPNISDEERSHYRELLSTLEESGQTEEQRREDNKTSTKLQNSMQSITEGLEKFGDDLDSFISSTAKGIGIAGLAMLFISPETAIEMFKGAVEFITKVITALTDAFNGSAEGFLTLISDHPFLSLLGALYLTFKAVTAFAGAITKAIGMWKQMPAAVQTIKTAAIFMQTKILELGKGLMAAAKSMGGKALTLLRTVGPMLMSGVASVGTAIAGAASSMIAAVAPLAIAAAPFVAVGAAVAAVIYSVVEAFDDFMSVFEETGSFIDALMAGFSRFFGTLVSLPFDMIKGLISTVSGWLGFDGFAEWLDSFSFSDIFTNAFSYVFDLIGDVLHGIVDAVTWPFRKLGEMVSSILDFDFTSMLRSIPGVGWLMDKMGFGDDEEEKTLKKEAKAEEQKSQTVTKSVDQSSEMVTVGGIEMTKAEANEAAKQMGMDAPYPEAVKKPVIVQGAEGSMDFMAPNATNNPAVASMAAPVNATAAGMGSMLDAVNPLNAVTSVFSNITSWVSEKAESVVTFLQDYTLLGPIMDVFSFIGDFVGNQIDNVVNFFAELDIFVAIKEGIEMISDFLGGAIQGAIDWVMEKLSWIPGIDSPEETRAKKKAEAEATIAETTSEITNVQSEKADLMKQMETAKSEDEMSLWEKGTSDSKEDIQAKLDKLDQRETVLVAQKEEAQITLNEVTEADRLAPSKGTNPAIVQSEKETATNSLVAQQTATPIAMEAGREPSTNYMVNNQQQNNQLVGQEKAAATESMTAVAVNSGGNTNTSNSNNRTTTIIQSSSTPDRAARDFGYVPID